MMNHFVYSLLALFIIASSLEDYNAVDKVKSNIYRDQEVFVDLLSKYGHEDCHVLLYFKNEYAEEVVKELKTINSHLLVQNFEEIRIKLDSVMVERYLEVDHLNALLVFNADQEVIDTIYRKNYEWYEDMIESQIIVTYRSDFDYSGHAVISLIQERHYDFQKAPFFIKDTISLDKINIGLHLNNRYIYNSGSTYLDLDTISFISYSDYTINKTIVYFLRNGVVCDSIMEGFVIEDLTPVPLIENDECLYVASVSIPETDAFWNVFLGIDMRTGKVRLYDRNRLKG